MIEDDVPNDPPGGGPSCPSWGTSLPGGLPVRWVKSQSADMKISAGCLNIRGRALIDSIVRKSKICGLGIGNWGGRGAVLLSHPQGTAAQNSSLCEILIDAHFAHFTRLVVKREALARRCRWPTRRRDSSAALRQVRRPPRSGRHLPAESALQMAWSQKRYCRHAECCNYQHLLQLVTTRQALQSRILVDPFC